jgi:hypothetical protein
VFLLAGAGAFQRRLAAHVTAGLCVVFLPAIGDRRFSAP